MPRRLSPWFRFRQSRQFRSPRQRLRTRHRPNLRSRLYNLRLRLRLRRLPYRDLAPQSRPRSLGRRWEGADPRMRRGQQLKPAPMSPVASVAMIVEAQRPIDRSERLAALRIISGLPAPVKGRRHSARKHQGTRLRARSGIGLLAPARRCGIQRLLRVRLAMGRRAGARLAPGPAVRSRPRMARQKSCARPVKRRDRAPSASTVAQISMKKTLPAKESPALAVKRSRVPKVSRVGAKVVLQFRLLPVMTGARSNGCVRWLRFGAPGNASEKNAKVEARKARKPLVRSSSRM